jgi:hypothetical protein
MKKIAISLLFLLCTHIAKAQVDISTSQLIDTKWEKIISGSKYDSTTTLFTIDEMIDSTYNSLLEVSTIRSLNYYITNELPSYYKFYSNYVGQERRGRYLVVYYPKVNEVDYYTVMSFTDDELVLFHKAKPGTIPGIDVYIKCKRIR